jgi:hypothetical protein
MEREPGLIATNMRICLNQVPTLEVGSLMCADKELFHHLMLALEFFVTQVFWATLRNSIMATEVENVILQWCQKRWRSSSE